MYKADAVEFDVDNTEDKYVDNDTLIDLDDDFYEEDSDVQAGFYEYNE